MAKQELDQQRGRASARTRSPQTLHCIYCFQTFHAWPTRGKVEPYQPYLDWTPPQGQLSRRLFSHCCIPSPQTLPAAEEALCKHLLSWIWYNHQSRPERPGSMLCVVNCKVIWSKGGRAVEKMKESIYGDEQAFISMHSPLLPTVPSCSAKALLTQASRLTSPHPWKRKRAPSSFCKGRRITK